MKAAGRKYPEAKRPPQQQRARDRIDAILAAAETVVAEGGYDSLTMVSIAARAGITHTSIYHYFRSVEAILLTLVSQLVDEYNRGVASELAKADTPAGLIDAVEKSLVLGYEMYRSRPVARGLAAATRYLPALRKFDNEDTVRTAGLIADRFVALDPRLDRDAVYIMIVLIGSLTAPAYEAALLLPRRQQKTAINDFLFMVRSRLSQIVLEPSC